MRRLGVVSLDALKFDRLHRLRKTLVLRRQTPQRLVLLDDHLVELIQHVLQRRGVGFDPPEPVFKCVVCHGFSLAQMPARREARNMLRFPLVLAAALFSLALPALAQTVLSFAHSHNDYERKRPLAEALENGFCGVEADVWFIDGELRVAHDRDKALAGRTLEKLYLAPLHERWKTNGGFIQKGASHFMLLIDVKSAAVPTTEAVLRSLRPYGEMLSRFSTNQLNPGAVSVILSGNRDAATVLGQSPASLASLDGRLPDLTNGLPSTIMPLVSESWQKVFQWRGKNPLPSDESAKLSGFIKLAHQQNRRLRFWASPDAPEAWRTFHAAGLDWINTDHPAEVQREFSNAAK